MGVGQAILVDDVAAAGPDLAASGAVLTIDLAALRANFHLLNRRAAPAECACVVKADAYGLGAAAVAPVLAAAGCRTFFVAHAGEGVALRRLLGAAPAIHVLNGLPPGAEPQAAAHALVPVANSLTQLAAWQAQARRAQARLPVTLQVDSGMNRLGMPPDEVARLSREPQRLDGLAVGLVMSHLACADEPCHPANEEQRARFERLRAMLPPAPASLANSSAIFLGPGFRHDLVRPGAALYGINPTPGAPNPMRPVVGLSAKIVQLRTAAAGEGVGYGHAFRAPAAMRLATIAIGYADGWQRRADGRAFFKGTPLPVLGRVSMDSVILDVSALAADALGPGDLVELIGPSQHVDDVAARAGTIGYEILTGLGRRFHRICIDAERDGQ